jgi:hypothetical protein
MNKRPSMDEFITVWNNLQIYLKPGTEIENWNTYQGYLGEDLTINEVDQNHISVDPPRVLDTQVVPKEMFEQIWEVWQDYRALRLKRSELRDMTNYSKYIISIFRWYETEQ